MYAVIETGGKQYRVEVGTELEVELLQADPGETVAFDRVLLIADGDTASIGTPVVANGSVAGEIVRRDRGEKLISFKYRPKARRRVKKGHRQELMVVRISDIVLDGKSAAKEVAKADEARRSERQKLEDAARRQAEQDAALAAKLAADKPAKTEPNADAKADSTADSKATANPKKKTGSAKAADTTEAGDAKTSTTSKNKSDASATTSRARKSDEG
jgi:large subunit ribosomal protein L21